MDGDPKDAKPISSSATGWHQLGMDLPEIPRSIFLVDDEPDQCRAMTRILKPHVPDILHAYRFDDALVMVSERSFDLALVDPPYTFDGWDEVLVALRGVALVVVETGSIFAAKGWEIVRQQRYGGTVVTLTTPEESAA